MSNPSVSAVSARLSLFSNDANSYEIIITSYTAVDIHLLTSYDTVL